MTTHQSLLLRQLLIALCALALTRSLALVPLPLAAAIFALLLSLLLRNPWWWHLIHAGFFPLAWLAASYRISPIYYLGAFVLCGVVFAGALRSRVPLYLSGKTQLAALSALIPDSAQRMADLGAGIGSAAAYLSRRHPALIIDCYEISPLTWLLGKLRTLHLPNVHWHFTSLENAPLGQYALVYAFLSPEPMPDLWQQVQAEMPDDSLFVSNSFPVPGIRPEATLLEASIHPLYVYRVNARSVVEADTELANGDHGL